MYNKHLKRVVDFILAFSALVILSPMMVIIAVFIRVKLGSPPIFKQQRPGKGMKPFYVYKFRSMIDKYDENGNLLLDELRVTQFGKFLRVTSLDELPQLFNILKGEMSIIGPRPLLAKYIPVEKVYRQRYDVRPGLTGLAQINGRNDLDYEERYKFDLEYVHNISFKNDFKIFFLTIRHVIGQDGVSPMGEAGTQPVRLGYTKAGETEMIA